MNEAITETSNNSIWRNYGSGQPFFTFRQHPSLFRYLLIAVLCVSTAASPMTEAKATDQKIITFGKLLRETVTALPAVAGATNIIKEELDERPVPVSYTHLTLPTTPYV